MSFHSAVPFISLGNSNPLKMLIIWGLARLNRRHRQLLIIANRGPKPKPSGGAQTQTNCGTGRRGHRSQVYPLGSPLHPHPTILVLTKPHGKVVAQRMGKMLGRQGQGTGNRQHPGESMDMAIVQANQYTQTTVKITPAPPFDIGMASKVETRAPPNAGTHGRASATLQETLSTRGRALGRCPSPSHRKLPECSGDLPGKSSFPPPSLLAPSPRY